jgi:hypothetical protein
MPTSEVERHHERDERAVAVPFPIGEYVIGNIVPGLPLF